MQYTLEVKKADSWNEVFPLVSLSDSLLLVFQNVAWNGNISLISFSNSLLLVFRNAINFCMLILYPATLLNLLLLHSKFYVCVLDTLLDTTKFLCPWDFPGKDVGWVAISFSRRSSRHRDLTHISCSEGRFLTI